MSPDEARLDRAPPPKEAPLPAARRSLRVPSRARHARPLPLQPAHGTAAWAAPLLAVIGVILLTTAAVSFASTREPSQVAAESVPLAQSNIALPAELPLELEIPDIKVTVPVKPVGVTVEQDLEVPAFGDSGWYKLGPSPGQPGHAIIAGHLDSKKGPDVFHQLHALEPGQEVAVRMSSGSVVNFRVDEVTQQSKDDLPESRMWNRSDRPQLALITCGGKFNKKLRSYPDNVVVYATIA